MNASETTLYSYCAATNAVWNNALLHLCALPKSQKHISSETHTKEAKASVGRIQVRSLARIGEDFRSQHYEIVLRRLLLSFLFGSAHPAVNVVLVPKVLLSVLAVALIASPGCFWFVRAEGRFEPIFEGARWMMMMISILALHVVKHLNPPVTMVLMCIFDSMLEVVLEIWGHDHRWDHEEAHATAAGHRDSSSVCRCACLAILSTLLCRLAEVDGSSDNPQKQGERCEAARTENA